MVVMYSAFAMGGPAPDRAVTLAQILDGVGGAGTIIFGVWLALYVDGYELWDGGILAALSLWAVAAETGRRSHAALRPAGAAEASTAAASIDPAMVRWHVIRTALIVVLLAAWLFKPGAGVDTLAPIRPDSWNVALFVHVLGAMVAVGGLVLALTYLLSAWRGDSARSFRAGYRALLFGAVPGYLVMRIGAQWVLSKEGLDDLPSD